MTRRVRWSVAIVLAGVLGLLHRSSPMDMTPFAESGRLILEGRFADVYASSFTQAGPLQLLISRPMMLGARNGVMTPLLRVMVNAGLMAAALAVCRRQPLRETVVAVISLLWMIGRIPFSGHLAEVTMPMLLSYGMALQSRGRWLWSSLAFAASALLTPLAVLGLPGLLAVAPFGKAVRTASVAALLTVLGYLPFVASGHFAMFGHVWQVEPSSLPYALGLRHVTWGTRVAQGLVIGGGCALVAYLRPGDLAAAPLAFALLRVVTDPLVSGYYWVPVGAAAVLVLARLADDEIWWRQALVLCASYLVMLSSLMYPGPGGAVAALLGFAVAGVFTPRRVFTSRSESRAAPTRPWRSRLAPR